MDRSINNIKQLFNHRLKQASSTMFYAKVKAVDQKEHTCDVEIDGATFNEVLLATNAPQVGIVMLPTVGSWVLVSSIGGSNQYAVAMLSQVDKISLTVNNSTIEVTDGEILINGGQLGGMVKVQELSDNLAKVTKRIDDVIAAIKGGKPTPQDGGTALLASIVLGLDAILEKEDFSDIENKKIKQ